jgi:uncharacterized protein (TIGR03437 family)
MAGYLVSVSTAAPASPVILLFNEQLQPVGGPVPVAGVPRQVLITDDGTRLVAITESTAAPLVIWNISASGLSQQRVLAGLAGTPKRMLLTRSGDRLLVLTSNPNRLYQVQLSTESVLPGELSLPEDALEAELTTDGEYLILIGASAVLRPVRLSDLSLQNPVPVNGASTGSSLSLSVSPFGSIFVAGQGFLAEFSGLAPFQEIARTAPLGPNLEHPGKLYFTPGGRTAFVVNRQPGGHSLGLVDFARRGASSPAGTLISTAILTQTTSGPFGATPQVASKLSVIGDGQAVAFSEALGQLFLVSLSSTGGLTVNDFRVNLQTVTGVKDFAVSGEFPSSLKLYWSTDSGGYTSFPLSGTGSVLSQTLSVGSSLSFVAGPSAGPARNMVGYGDSQSVAPNAKLRYFVKLIDGSGRPVKGATVTFRSQQESVVLSSTTATTDREGIAYIDVTAPPTAGIFVVEGTHSNLAPAVLTSAVVPTGGSGTGGGGGSGGSGGGSGSGVPRLVKVSGDGQLLTTSIAFDDLVVRAVDAVGNPIAGKQILWRTTSLGVTFLSPVSTVTDADGLARIQLLFVDDPTNIVSLFSQAQIEALSDIGSTVFYITKTTTNPSGWPLVSLLKPEPPERTITLKLGKPESGKVQVRIVTGFVIGSQQNAPIPNVGVRVTSRNQDPQAGPVIKCVEPAGLTNEQGVGTCTLLAAGKPGTTSFTVQIGNEYKFEDLVAVVEPGDPVPPEIVSGNNQTGLVGTTLPQRLVARIKDPGGSPLPGQTVTWVVSNPNAVQLVSPVTVSDSDGLVSTGVRLLQVPGQHQIEVQVGNLKATFTVTAQVTLSLLRKDSGDGQPAADTNTAFPQPLVVEVLDNLSRPAPGTNVNWTVSGPATLSAASTVTDSNGRAQVTVTAGAVAGPITVTASVTNLGSVSFSLQSRLPGPRVTAQSFRNYATNETGVAPGNLVILSGSGIAKNVTGAAVANLLVGRLPIEFKGLVVEFRSGGRSYFAPIYWIVKEGNVEEALLQVPYEISGTTVDVNVSVDQVSTLVTGVPVKPLSPGIIEDQIDGRRAAIVIRSDGLVATKATPARRGETVRLYAIGLGQATPLAETNRVGRPDQKVTATVAVGIDNSGVEVVEAKLAENLIGIYEVLFKIPENAQLGDRPLGLVVEASPGQPFYAQGSVIPIGPAE